MKYAKLFVLAAATAVSIASCQNEISDRPLPILGERDIAANGDTIYPVFRIFHLSIRIVRP